MRCVSCFESVVLRSSRECIGNLDLRLETVELLVLQRADEFMEAPPKMSPARLRSRHGSVKPARVLPYEPGSGIPAGDSARLGCAAPTRSA